MVPRSQVLIAAALVAPALAQAGGVDSDDPSPRSIGRAGATIVSDDGQGALLFSPASMARRSETRVRIGLAVRDRDIDFDAGGNSPEVGDRSTATLSPTVSIVTSFGPLVIGAAYIEPRAFETRLPGPSFGQPPDDIERLFPHRYSGLAYSIRTRELRVGAATRLGDWFAVGAAIAGRRVDLRESRTIWPGFSGRDGLANPSRDLQLTMEGKEELTPAGTLGVFVAPLDVPIEFSVAVTGQLGAQIVGTATGVGTGPGSPRLFSDGAAQLRLPDQLIVSSGLRLVTGRVASEIGFLWRHYNGRSGPQSWSLADARIFDVSGVEAELTTLPSQLSQKSHGSIQGAVELEILSGFLWLTSGYRYQGRAVRKGHLTPTTSDIGAHTAAFGAEVYVRGITATIGYSRSFADDIRRRDGSTMLVNPFGAGSQVVGDGTYDRADDRVGVSIEMSWGDSGADASLNDL